MILILHFNTQSLQLSPTSTEVVLTGQLTDDTLIKGINTVRIIQKTVKQTILAKLFSYINQFFKNLISAIGLAGIRY